ncbi:alkaline phosphatase [Colletotrichum truncatum]|uniref:Alkaline phosphatase n=1 Tax=Colletotrichum truncatum TaxID=5467 RepID=A0ACC3ZH78_COLTU|nr:alkaline phosphatase [Colletotrichum truncatum]KAF6790615.1 alkaline phosphatase [Colletotrichum truncatum]
MPPLPPNQPLPRVITYYQTHHTHDGKPISILPLVTQPGISVTHVILAAIHINDDPEALTLNDHHPSDPRFLTLWAELRVLQASGVKVLGMLGGAARGSYERLDGDEAQFEKYYIPLRDMVRQHGLDGIDLDVEEEMSLGGVIRLIDRIRQDFGKDFLITMAPVAMALLDPLKNLSGFDYEALEVMRGREIAWYNTQFYCGWGDCSNPVMYEMLLAKGWPPEKVVIGLVTNPENGSGWVPWEMLGSVLLTLRGRYERFGGVMGWEYFNSLPGGKERPWEWAKWMTTMLRSEQSSFWPAHGVLPVETREIAKEVKKDLVDEADPDGPNSKDAPLPASFDYYSDTNNDD